MWYVMQTGAGQEETVIRYIRQLIDPDLCQACFSPKFEDVWRKQGVGHIAEKRLFPGYLFLETGDPAELIGQVARIPKLTKLLGRDESELPPEGGERDRDTSASSSPKVDSSVSVLPIYEEEENFLRTVLDGDLMRVSYIERDPDGKIGRIIGPLEYYRDRIVKIDVPHRRAVIKMDLFGRERTIKFGLWTAKDDPIPWIEEARKNPETKKHDV